MLIVQVRLVHGRRVSPFCRVDRCSICARAFRIDAEQAVHLFLLGLLDGAHLVAAALPASSNTLLAVVPVDIATFLPAAFCSINRIPEIILAVLVFLHRIPREVCLATTRARAGQLVRTA